MVNYTVELSHQANELGKNEENEMIKVAYANEAGAGVVYTDGSSIKWIASLNITITTDSMLNETRVDGRVGI